MTVALEDPRIVHATPGRLRMQLPGWSGVGQRALENGLRQVPGIQQARADSLTGNVLVRFDPKAIAGEGVVAAVRHLLPRAAAGGKEPAVPAAHLERRGNRGRGRIAVRGLDRDPMLARHVVDRLASRPGVHRVSASPLTGRALIEFDTRQVSLDDLIADVMDVELPEVPDETLPSHPLDPGPLRQSALRTAEAGIGLAILAGGRMAGRQFSPLVRSRAAGVSAVIGLVQGFPFARYGLRRLLGRDLADLVFHVPGILSLTLSSSWLGLLVIGGESVRLLSEVLIRRSSWRRYEDLTESAPVSEPGSKIRLENGERTPRAAGVQIGVGIAIDSSGLPVAIVPGAEIGPGARLYGGPFSVELRAAPAFTPLPRPIAARSGFFDRYSAWLGPVSLAYAALTGIITRSFGRAFGALLLVNPRPALIGLDTADIGASARVLRSGSVVAGTRFGRVMRKPDLLVLGQPRILTSGLEVSTAHAFLPGWTADSVLARAAGIAAAAGTPWGGAFRGTNSMPDEAGTFDGVTARAVVDGVACSLGPNGDIPASLRLEYRGEHLLMLRNVDGQAIGCVGLRPRLADGVAKLTAMCQDRGIPLGLLPSGDLVAAQGIAERTGIQLLASADAVGAIRSVQATGATVAYVSDNAGEAAALAAADLSVGLSSGRSERFPARADLLAPDLFSLTAIADATARRDAVVRDSVVLSLVSNLIGASWGLRSAPAISQVSYPIYGAALAALADGWLRLRGGTRAVSSIVRMVDPRPERWGRRGIESVLEALHASREGLASEQAAGRREIERPLPARNVMVQAILDQLRSPLTGILAAGAALSLVLGSVADVVMIGGTIVGNALVGAYQERQAGEAVAALQRIGTTTAEVLRDGAVRSVPAHDVVPGDVLVLRAGVRIAADARLLTAYGLEVDEATLTGESVPVPKMAEGGTDANRVVLAGSDVTVGTGRAVVFAVGNRSRMGAIAAAMAIDETSASPLGVRLNHMLRQVLPLAGIGGLLVFASGWLRRRPLLPQLAIASTIAIAAIPEGLPLLAGVGEAAVARRLAHRNVLVHRLSAVEALGRVDIACTDKTGTLTEGRPSVQLVATIGMEGRPGDLPSPVRRVLLAAGMATPHPDAADAAVHPTDVTVRAAAETAGFARDIRETRVAEASFDPARPFHAAVVRDVLYAKGAEEVLLPRCDRIWKDGDIVVLDDAERETVRGRSLELARRGLRILMVAEGSPNSPVTDPQRLIALGFIGIIDPLRPNVRDAVRRCQEAGVRIIMLTGDHPATARAIALEAGIMTGLEPVLSGDEIVTLEGSELDRRLDRASVVARVTPLDKLRIVESLQRQGHAVAMTGDGVNDAPALRLADVGVAMGRGGTEVARQAAAVVLADDDFSSLVEALVEGRSFWRNIRRALSLLLGGNLGELALMVGASVLGFQAPMVTRQILAVNLVTDALPSLAVALQAPETRTLSSLSREGAASLDAPLRNAVLARGGITAGPALAAYIMSLRRGLPEARSVAFASIVATQLAQTLQAGRSEGSITRPVLGAVGGSALLMAGALMLPPLSGFLGLVVPSLAGWLLIAGGAFLAGVLVSLRPGLVSERDAGRGLRGRVAQPALMA